MGKEGMREDGGEGRRERKGGKGWREEGENYPSSLFFDFTLLGRSICYDKRVTGRS